MTRDTETAQPLIDVLENDIRELRGANPGELATRLVERGWTLATAPGSTDDAFDEALDGMPEETKAFWRNQRARLAAQPRTGKSQIGG